MASPDRRSALHTPLCDLLGCEVPVLLAGMGGVARAGLAAAVARAGGYATLGMSWTRTCHPCRKLASESEARLTT